MIRQGRATGRRDVVLHLALPTVTEPQPSTVGLIVGRAVGGSVVRHRVSRRLRAQLTERIPQLPSGAALVIRAKASAAEVDSAELGRQLDSGLATLTRSAAGRAAR